MLNHLPVKPILKARKKNFLGYFALVCIFAIVCVMLAFWQYTRAENAMFENQALERNLMAPIKPVENIEKENPEWRLVEARGRYLYEKQLLLRNTWFRSDVGFGVLTPLRLSDGKILIVKRGWIKNAQQATPKVYDKQPEQHMILRLQKPVFQDARINNGQINRLNLSVIKSYINSDVITDFYAVPNAINKNSPVYRNTGETDSLYPGSSEMVLPIGAIFPAKNVGMHWSYAFQWVVFAVAAFLAFFYCARKDVRARKSYVKNKIFSRRKRITDEEYEDLLEG